MARMLKDYVFEAKSLALEFSPGKNVVVACNLGIAHAVVARLRQSGITTFKAVPFTRDVGVDFAGGRKRRRKVIKARLAKGYTKLKTVGQLTRSCKGAKKLVATGSLPAVLYGEEAYGLQAGIISSLRNQSIEAAGASAKFGCKAASLELTLGRRADPWLIYLTHVVTSFYDLFRAADGSLRGAITRHWVRSSRKNDVAGKADWNGSSASSPARWRRSGTWAGLGHRLTLLNHPRGRSLLGRPMRSVAARLCLLRCS